MCALVIRQLRKASSILSQVGAFDQVQLVLKESLEEGSVEELLSLSWHQQLQSLLQLMSPFHRPTC